MRKLEKGLAACNCSLREEKLAVLGDGGVSLMANGGKSWI